MTDIIEKINITAEFITEEDLDDWVIPGLLEYFNTRLISLANKTYGVSSYADGPSVAQLAFKERAKSELRSAVHSFIFKHKHYETGRDIVPYLMTVLNRLSSKILIDVNNVKKTNAMVCPGCKFLNKRSFLTTFDSTLNYALWKCSECSDALDRTEIEIKQAKGNDCSSSLIFLEPRLTLFKAFAIHSRSGFKCPDCGRFIPESTNGPHGIACPYSDCCFVGSIDNLEKVAHPVVLSQRNNLSLHNPLSDDSSSPTMQDLIVSDTVDADHQIEVNEIFESEYNMLSDVIQQQLSSIKRTNYSGTMLQKVLMYEAFQCMLEKHPEDMVSYLVHRKQNADFPIQAKIFQEYCGLMQESLPCTLTKGGQDYEVVSLMDPNISLFEGISSFEAVVKNDYTIPNNTEETYTGGRKLKDYGPCFIGMLLDVVDQQTSESIRNKVIDYSFVSIKVSKDIEPGTNVMVTHYRIPSHYEMKSLTYLQRSRKRIVDSVYYKMNGKKRTT